MKKLVKTTVMFLLFLGIVLTTNAQETKTRYTFVVAASNKKSNNKQDAYFSKIISLTCIKGLDYYNSSYQCFNDKTNEFKNMWVSKCQIMYDKKDEYYWTVTSPIFSKEEGYYTNTNLNL